MHVNAQRVGTLTRKTGGLLKRYILPTLSQRIKTLAFRLSGFSAI